MRTLGGNLRKGCVQRLADVIRSGVYPSREARRDGRANHRTSYVGQVISSA